MAIQTRIKQRFDLLSNWTENNIVLLDGELAIVDCGSQTIRFKVGDGKSKFSQLPYVDKHIIAESITQGIHSSAVPYGLAAGAYLSANANFSQAFGYDVQVSSSHPYAFVWNGDDTRAIGDYYESHGKGTFNINALSGLSGIFIGEQSLAELLDSKGGNKITIDDRISGISGYSDLSVVKLSANEYASLLTSNSLLSNTLYIVQDNYMDAYGQQIKNLAAGTDLSDAVTVEQLSNAISSIDGDYLPLSGGEVSGDVSILSGNYLQTSTPDKVTVYGNNSFVQAESTKYGNAVAGSKGYYIIGLPNLSCLVLSGNINAYDLTSQWSITLSNLFESQQVKIVDVNETSVYLDQKLPVDFNAMVGKPASYFEGLIEDSDDNTFYCPVHAEFGNIPIKRFSSNHIEGGSTHAIGQFSHAEGRATIADGRYAHAEGSHGIAGGLASHAEGQETNAIGNQSHAEGQQSKALARWSHAEGWLTTASSNAAHAEGGETLASGNRSHAEGNLTKAIGAYTHAEGAKTIAGNAELSDIAPFSETADGVFAHAEGNGTLAKGNASHAEGYATYAKRQAGHAEGYQTSATALYSHAEGKMTFADGESTHAEGNQTTAFSLYCHAEGNNTYAGASGKKAAHAEGGFTKATNDYAHAEGLSTLAKALYSHAEGLSTWADGQASHAEGYAAIAFNSYCHAEGQSTYAGRALGATGNCEASHAEGLSTYAVGQASHAEGYQTSAVGLYSHAAGYKACASNQRQFVWNGNTSQYNAQGNAGTFNINPVNGLSGTYIGLSSLAQFLDQKQNKLSGKSLQIVDPTITLFKVQTTSSYKKSGIYSAQRDDTTKPVVIDWGDGMVEQVNGDISQKVHTYATIGTFETTISNIKTFDTNANNYTWYSTTSQNRFTLKEVVLGSSVTGIGNYAFFQCSELTSVTIGNGVTSIGDDTFGGCTNLTGVTIPDSVTSIGTWAFSGCSRLASVKIPDSVTSIGDYAFKGCSGLTSVTIPDSVTSIGYGAFSSCSSLAKIIFKNRQLSQIPSGSPWSAPSTTVIETWNDASQEWVSSQISVNLTSADISAAYANQHIYLSAAGQVVGNIDCTDFIKDGMLSTVELCSNQLVFKFNTESEQDPISVDLSSFVDNYDATIQAISAEVSALPTKADIENGWLSEWTFLETVDGTTSESDAYNVSYSEGYWTLHENDSYIMEIEGDENALSLTFQGVSIVVTATRRRVAIPTKTSELSNDSGFLTEHQSLSNYYTKFETSSASEISNALSSKQDISALFADVSSIVLSSVNGWVITNETEWSLVSGPIFYPEDGWWEAEFSDGNATVNVIDFNNQDATQLHFENEDPDLDVYLEKKNINVLSVVTYDYLATSYEQKSSLQSDVSSIVLSSAPYGDILLVSEFGTLVKGSTSPEIDYSFSGEIGTHHLYIYHFTGVDNSYWAWEGDADYGNTIENFDIDTDQFVTINIANTPLATELGVSSITFTKTQKTGNVLGLVTFDSLSTELSAILSKYKTYDATVSSLSDDGYALYSQVSSKAEVSALNAKITIDDRIFGVCEQADLSIVHLSSSGYAQLCADGQLLSNALYIVEDSFTNNYGKQIKNVAGPTLSDDAATKAYVDNIVNQQTSALIQRIQALENQLSGLEEQLHTINNG